ncbi:MAG TPA: hypothetical protein DCR93_29610, partial [Cytophagales bacterium]|nr:hypothetical protein [Cytophagales bacterium]
DAADKKAMEQRGYRPQTKAVQMAGAVNLLRTPFTGFQAAGGVNLVVQEVEGAQLAGLGNANGDYLVGFQGAGLFNYVKKFGIGVQLSGLYNQTDRDFTGFQISGGYNRTKLLEGIQIGLVNRSKRVTGWGSPETPRFKSAQIGLVNITKDQDAFQIGLLNLYRPGSRGVSLGILNLGGPSWLSSYTNERHLFNIEVATGNTMTDVKHHTQKWWSTYNTVGFSTVGWYGKTREITWGMGADLTFKKGYFFRSTLRMYYPWEKGAFREWNGMYGSVGMSAGFIPVKKYSFIWLFLSPTYNWHMLGPVEGIQRPAVALPISENAWGSLQIGVVFG